MIVFVNLRIFFNLKMAGKRFHFLYKEKEAVPFRDSLMFTL